MDKNYVAPLTKHQHGVIYLSSPVMDTIDSFKIKLKDWLQPKGYAFYGGAKKFSGGKGFSIPTHEFELCLQEYFPRRSLQVLLFFYLFAIFIL